MHLVNIFDYYNNTIIVNSIIILFVRYFAIKNISQSQNGCSNANLHSFNEVRRKSFFIKSNTLMT